MRRSVLRWTCFLIALLIVGPLVGRLVSLPHGVDGDVRSAPLVSQNPALGAGVALAAVAIAGVYAVLVSRWLGIAAGMNCAGVIFGWCAWNAGTIDSLLRAAPDAATLVRLAIEAALIGAGAIVAVGVMTRTSSDAASLRSRSGVLAPANLISAVVAVLVGAACVMLIAYTPLKGQAVFAVLVAAIAVGAVTQLGAAGAGHFVPMVVPFIAMVVLAVGSPLIGIQWHGSKLIEASRAGTLLGLVVPHGFDWLCGAFLGVPVGVAWAESMMERQRPASEAPAA